MPEAFIRKIAVRLVEGQVFMFCDDFPTPQSVELPERRDPISQVIVGGTDGMEKLVRGEGKLAA